MATRDWLAEGARFLAKDDLINAISAYRNAVRASTRDFRGHLGLAQALERNEARHAAWVSYRAARRFAGKAGVSTAQLETMERTIARLKQELEFAYLRIGYTHLTHCVYANNLARVEAYLTQGEDVNGKDYYGTTPLMAAARHAHLDICQVLLLHGADVNLCGTLQRSPLQEAVAGKDVQIVRLLLAHGADPQHAATERKTALWDAIFTVNNPTLVRLLLASGATPNEEYEYGVTALCLACEYDRREIIGILLDAGADPRARTRDEATLLALAAYHKDIALAERLLAMGLDVNSQNNYGQTPLIQAVEQNSTDMVLLLLKHGANVHHKTQYGVSALSAARKHYDWYDVEYRSQSGLVDILIQAGAKD